MKNSPKAAKGSAAAKKKAATKASPAKKGRPAKPRKSPYFWMRDDEPKEEILKHFPGATDVKLRKEGNKRYLDVIVPPWHDSVDYVSGSGRGRAGKGNAKKTQSKATTASPRVPAVKTTPSKNKQPAKGRKAKTPVKSPKKRELEEVNSIEQHIEAEELASTSKSPARRGRGQAKSSVVGIKTEPPKTPTKSPGKRGRTKVKSEAEDVVDNEEVLNGEEPKTPSKASPRGKKGAAKLSPKQKKGRAASTGPKTPEKPSPRKRKSESGNQSTGDDVNSAEEAGTPSKRRRLANANSNDQVVNGEEPPTRGRKPVGRGRGAKNASKSPAVKSPRGKKTANAVATSPATVGGRTPRKSSAKSSSGSPKALKKKPARKAGRPAKSVKSKSPKKSKASKI